MADSTEARLASLFFLAGCTPDGWLRVEDAALLLGVCPERVRQLAVDERLRREKWPGLRGLLYLQKDVERLARRRARPRRGRGRRPNRTTKG